MQVLTSSGLVGFHAFWRGDKTEQFFDCGESRDGTGYKDETDSTDPEVKAARARFAAFLVTMPEPKPRAGRKPKSQK